MSEDVVVRYEFDQFPRQVGHCFLRESANLDFVVVRVGDDEHVILEAYRDQWGTWLSFGSHKPGGQITIAQEDCTRSFLDGLIQCLQVLRERQEVEGKPASQQVKATSTPTPPPAAASTSTTTTTTAAAATPAATTPAAATPAADADADA